jgi:hypothetical protein
VRPQACRVIQKEVESSHFSSCFNAFRHDMLPESIIRIRDTVYNALMESNHSF